MEIIVLIMWLQLYKECDVKVFVDEPLIDIYNGKHLDTCRAVKVQVDIMTLTMTVKCKRPGTGLNWTDNRQCH